MTTTDNLIHCRFCGENKRMENLLNLSRDQEILQDIYKKMEYLKVDFLDLECNILPKTICQLCYKSLGDTYIFLQKVKSAQIILKDFYNNTVENTFELTMKTESDQEKYEDNYIYEDNFQVKEIENAAMIFKKDPVDLDSEKILSSFENPTGSAVENLKQNNRRKCTKKPKLTNDKNCKAYKSINTFRNISKPSMHTFNTSMDTLKNTNNTSKDTFKNTSNTSIDTFMNTDTKDISWMNYEWTCCHCQAKFNSMTEIRDHSKVVHAICYGFQCMDCTEQFNYFNPFIEHVRQHREKLRLHCQYCNIKSATADEITVHAASHWRASHICELCGEDLPSRAALVRHKRVYKKAPLPSKCYKKKLRKVKCAITWKQYEWTCQDCCLKLPDITSLRTHTREIHSKCFAMKCVDCLAVMINFKQFIEHVVAHRSCLRNYCQFCNEYYPNDQELDTHISSHTTTSKSCDGCGDMFADSASLTQHMTLFDAPRVRGTSNSESLTCGVCNKHFPNGFQLKNHKVIHSDKRERDQVCHTCGKAFFDAKTLANHIKTHYNKTETCEICQKTFLTKQRLKVHIATHLEIKQFVCNECGKKFRRKSQLRLHLASHSNVLPFQCQTCSKRFRLQSYLKIHERQHTGIRPYSCEVCNETFNHWGNCNRHMIRKHGVTFAKTKITAQGKLEINRETGEAKKIEIGGNAREWCDEMLRPKKRGRKKKETI